jgi:hypothetical protein
MSEQPFESSNMAGEFTWPDFTMWSTLKFKVGDCDKLGWQLVARKVVGRTASVSIWESPGHRRCRVVWDKTEDSGRVFRHLDCTSQENRQEIRKFFSDLDNTVTPPEWNA